MQPIEVPVLVVGAGPVGLMASLLLARRGVRSLVVDRRDGPHRAPQAHVINPRTLEICRAAGVDMARLRARATRREDGSLVVWMTKLAGEELGRLPYERQGDENLQYTPTPLLNLSQHLFELILLDRLREESDAEVRYRHQWGALEQDGGGVLRPRSRPQCEGFSVAPEAARRAARPLCCPAGRPEGVDLGEAARGEGDVHGRDQCEMRRPL